MDTNQTTLVVQRYLDELAVARGDDDVGPIISALLGQSVRRLQLLCNTLLHRGYPRLARPPVGLQVEDLLGAVVERLLKALRETRPGTVRGFFALASRHMRWELNDLARRLDHRDVPFDVHAIDVAAPAESDSGLGTETKRMLDAIDALPEDEREVLELVMIHGMTHEEAAAVIGSSTKTVQRRLNRARHVLVETLGFPGMGPSRSDGPGTLDD
ncbi:sigma-70 family RNA polymerase sigma factor [Paludisphaera mucosa]|uniref:Sigma-70 family RNA polymerase sigma factor n=1 Tax=Paludisphaera mucosa TaxID=3030827 RepID=A0ABT6FLF5_9BACT|nr:sigma-70 family RNA polymerase sigma factor [Paludisphaera mucosa]MDG3008401.1 sigma-70 family RNA polymerase sigma factor [Paludisphaera mucosa]